MGHKNGLVHFMNKTVVLNENQNFIGTMDFASEKGIRDVQRLSESWAGTLKGIFMKEIVLEHKHLVRKIQHL